MARRIVLARKNPYLPLDCCRIDSLIEVRSDGRQLREVYLHGEMPANGGYALGTLEDVADLEWLKKIVSSALDEDRIEDVVGRINELDVSPDRFAIELLTGSDARDILIRKKLAVGTVYLRSFWFLIPVALVALWLVFLRGTSE